MDKRSRAWKLYLQGKAAFDSGPADSHTRFLLALATMIDAATAKGTAAKPLTDPDAVSLVDTLLQVAGDKIQAEVFDAKWYKLAEWRMREVEGMTMDSAYVVGEFLANDGWKGKAAPTVEQVIRYYPDLMRQAEEQGVHDPRFNV